MPSQVGNKSSLRAERRKLKAIMEATILEDDKDEIFFCCSGQKNRGFEDKDRGFGGC
jgi:hypothetical protein